MLYLSHSQFIRENPVTRRRVFSLTFILCIEWQISTQHPVFTNSSDWTWKPYISVFIAFKVLRVLHPTNFSVFLLLRRDNDLDDRI